MLRPARDSSSEQPADAPIALENLGCIRRNYYSNRSNLQLTDLDTAVRELATYQDLGGGGLGSALEAAGVEELGRFVPLGGDLVGGLQAFTGEAGD